MYSAQVFLIGVLLHISLTKALEEQTTNADDLKPENQEMDHHHHHHHHMPEHPPFSKVEKSLWTDDPVIQYSKNISVKQDELEKELYEKTIQTTGHHFMLGAPEVLQLGKNMIRLIKAKRALDIGTYTGASALAWALALPPDGEVLTMDVNDTNLNAVGKPIFEKRPEIAKKIILKLGPALETLDALIHDNQTGKWDFAFIDADKENYPNYYERCVQLLRPGGVILIDNALRGGRVVLEDKDPAVEAIDKTNKLAANDSDVDNILLNLGDGAHLIFKL